MLETDSVITFSDRLGAWKARWGIGRMNYKVAPGLYRLGRPDRQSPVFVSANYKMSFDILRSSLSGRDGWILVLDTKGINVWCAAGKGTFGTMELMGRIVAEKLEDVVSHRTVICPQLGAPGIRQHVVKGMTGFNVVYGPVRAVDLPAFLDAGLKASPEMRRVRFGFLDRLVLSPMELVTFGKYFIPTAILAFLFDGPLGMLILLSFLCGAVLVPALLPFVPLRSFSGKGAVIGLLAPLALRPLLPCAAAPLLSAALMSAASASFVGMNFTGASTYTGMTGVRKEMRVAVPLQLACAALGLGLWIYWRLAK